MHFFLRLFSSRRHSGRERKGRYPMNQERKLREASKAANRTIFNRTLVLMAVFGGLLFLLLIFQLYRLQIVQHEELEEQAIDQQTSELSVSALRGTIYDSNGNVLAISSTAYDVIISPKAISERQAALDEARTEAQEKGEDTADYDWNVEDVICGIIADEISIGVINTKTTAVRVIPAYGKGVGESIDFGGLLGRAPVMEINRYSPAKFISRGGRIPAPIHSLKN